MTFSRAKASGWTNDNTIITAAQINTIDTNQSNAVDGSAGGVYTALIELNNFKSSGIKDSSVTESVTFDTTSEEVHTPQLLTFGAVTGTTESIRDLAAGVGGQLFLIDDSIATGNNTVEVKTASTPKYGDTVRLSCINPSAHVLAVHSEAGGSNPIVSFSAASNILWADLMYDTVTSAWIVVAQGDL